MVAFPGGKYMSQLLSDIFLPYGFPDSVRPDYTRYQVFDSLQAFCSSIAGLLASRAVLEGFGVGDETASPTNAVFLTVLQDATGRLATIVFAWKFSLAIASETKLFRFAADVFNDCAILLDCLSPALPQSARITVLCLAGALRAACGVCAGASKAALSAHFAKTGNVAELNAKDSSQETVIGLLGMMCGTVLMSCISSRSSTWVTLVILLAAHLYANFLAVKGVALNTLNRQRLVLLLQAYEGGQSTSRSPEQISRSERILYSPNRFYDGQQLHPISCSICTSADQAKLAIASSKDALPFFVRELKDEKFLIVATGDHITIILKEGIQLADRLKAWIFAYKLSSHPSFKEFPEFTQNLESILRSVRVDTNKVWIELARGAKEYGWDLSTDAISTGFEFILPPSSFGFSDENEKKDR